ncbi:GIY-YIG nuclease family protein [Patescibacteria group bacterium]|nr:GIY-YIG nuclease family protein [Patescibacteria group bacterium]
MFWYTYILFCDQKIFYVGITNNLRKRVEQHKKKQSPYTKKFSDIKLVYFEKYESRRQAEKREIEIKKWSIAKKKSLIRGDIELLKKLSKGHKIGE